MLPKCFDMFKVRTQFCHMEANLESASLVAFPSDRLSSSHDSGGRTKPRNLSRTQRRKNLSQGHRASRQGTDDSNSDRYTLLDGLWPFRIILNFSRRTFVCSLIKSDQHLPSFTARAESSKIHVIGSHKWWTCLLTLKQTWVLQTDAHK